MTFKNSLPVWYGLELETVQNVAYNVGSLTRTGFIFPKCKIMNAQNEKLQNIEKLTKDCLSTIKKDHWGDDAILTTLPAQGGYNSMFLTAQSLINVCRIAIEANNEFDQPVSLYDISTTLELATEFIPLAEAEYLDKMRAEFDNKSKSFKFAL